MTISDKSVFDLKLQFLKHTMQSYNTDLLMLFEMKQSADERGMNLLDDFYHVFSTSMSKLKYTYLSEKFTAKAEPLDCL